MSETDSHAVALSQAESRAGHVHQLAELSFKRIDALDRERTVVLFSVSPLEEHGPHLPVGADVFHSEFFNQELAKRIISEKPGWNVIIGPPIPIGSSAFDHAGTLLVRPRTVRSATLDYGAALARHDFRYILVTNAHAGPRHLVALEEAAAAVSRRYGVRMLLVSGPVLWGFLRGQFADRVEPLLGRPFTPEEREAIRGDSHGGMWETLLLLCSRPDLVEKDYCALPPVRFNFLDNFRKNYPLQMGNQLGYVGSPAAATWELGEAARSLLADVTWEAVRPVLDAQNEIWWQTSWFYKVPFLRTSFPHVAGAVGLLILMSLIWWLL